MMLSSKQEVKTIGYLGPRGTYSEEVAFQIYQGNHERFTPYPSIDTAIRAVMSGETDECVVPLENSVEGSVNITLDTLAHEADLFITREIVRPIGHNLLIKAGTQHVNVIVSHPQALAQCRHYLYRCYPQAELKAMESTAEAAYRVACGAINHAAIASLRSADLYGLEVLATNVQDHPNNSTRFVVLGRKQVLGGNGRYKTSLACQIDGQKPGSLCDVLQEFSVRNVNLTRIESRPARTGLGMYIFFLDLEGSQQDDNVAQAVMAVRQQSQWFKIFGSYPVHKLS